MPSQPDPHDDKVRSVPLPDDDRVIGQENNSPEVAMGSGEWPSPAEPPTGPAPGGDGDSDDRDRPAHGAIREVLEADPVVGGSKSTPADDEDAPSAGAAKPAWPA
ncbi:MAG TPA: hypothetical protein VFJ85_09530 [Acidimicrobiales bacterium]|nr:hypothetical protein [Acidimicrobiales bacterium]